MDFAAQPTAAADHEPGVDRLPPAPTAGGVRPRLARAAGVFGLWTLVALLFTSQIFLGMLDHGHAWWRILLWQAAAWYLWGLATPLVVWLARRLPLDRAPRVLKVLLHFAAAAVLALAHLVPLAVATSWIEPYAPVMEALPFPAQYAWLLNKWFHLDVIVYWAILGLAYAWDYYQRYRERELRAAHLESLVAKAELQALKLRLHPHFLFNALNAVAGLVRRGDNAAAVSMLAGLAELFRYVLDGADRQLVPLTEEIAFVERYLDVQRLRFGDRLRVEIDVAADALDLAVPSLILQPLVENALEHGLARRDGPGRVELSARREGSRLRIRLRDDGRGLAVGAGGSSATGHGLDDSRARLRELYGDRFELALRAAEGPGAIAELVIPATPHVTDRRGDRPG